MQTFRLEPTRTSSTSSREYGGAYCWMVCQDWIIIVIVQVMIWFHLGVSPSTFVKNVIEWPMVNACMCNSVSTMAEFVFTWRCCIARSCIRNLFLVFCPTVRHIYSTGRLKGEGRDILLGGSHNAFRCATSLRCMHDSYLRIGDLFAAWPAGPRAYPVCCALSWMLWYR